jgi:Protein of unknown function (DUF1064)
LSTATEMRKYRNTPVVVDGQRFDSKKEKRRFDELILLQKAGRIQGLVRQPSFDLVVNGMKVARYIADHRYSENGNVVVEDCKSPATAKNSTYRLKKKLMKALYGIEIQEV